MPPPKSTPKRGSSPNSWNECEACGAKITGKDVGLHSGDCPPNTEQPTHSFIKDGVLYGVVDVKANEEIKGVSAHDRDNLVFLSQSVIQLCDVSIGDNVIVECAGGTSYVRTVWPTQEKTITSILFTKNCLDVSVIKPNTLVKLYKITNRIRDAKRLSVVILNAPKSMDLSPELNNRLHKSHIERYVSRGNMLGVLFYGKTLKFEVKEIESSVDIESKFSELDLGERVVEFFKITEKTAFDFFKNETEYVKEVKTAINPFGKIGGLHDEISELNDLINSVLGQKHVIPGFKTTRAVLLYGSSGTGKSLLANAIASVTTANVVRINAADLYGKLKGNPEENIRDLFREAREQAPSLMVFEEIDVLCPSRTSRLSDTEKRIVSCILVQLDEINECEDEKIFVLATTNKLESLDASFRRCGRFEREIEIPVPNPKARLNILKKILKEAKDNISGSFLEDIAYATHGFVGADLVALCSRAALHASCRDRKVLDHDDFKFALTRVRPSAMREVQVEVPNVKWRDIGGQDKLKLILKQCVEWPLKHAESFVRLGITPPRGVLMYGPPGCSKTMIAKALATESGLNFLSIKGPELFSKWVGESERAVREVFRKARQVAPSIVFFDEIDALGGERTTGASSSSVQERVLAQLLTELDGVTPLGDVTILAATNRPDRIDKALLRPGRLDRIVYVPLPDANTRNEIFKIKFEKMPVHNVSRDELVVKTKGYSGAEVNAVCHEAAMAALEDDLDAKSVTSVHFKKALDIITPRTSASLLRIYEEYHNKQNST